MIARRSWAWPLVPLYAAGLAVKDGLRAAGALRTRKLEWPVISVGSLSAGGAGKTPVVIALAELLAGRGWQVDVLSRGYGRLGKGVERVDRNALGAAVRFGDEPVLIARRTGMPVWLGAERYAAGLAAESNAGVTDAKRRVHLLDDGFQHRRLARNIDVVLVTEADLSDALLPAGNRRESLRALQRADVVVLREEEHARVESRVREWMPGDAALWVVARKLRFAEEMAGNDESQDSSRKRESAQSTTLSRSVAFCAIARPEGFWSMLAAAGCDAVGTVAFGDHHGYDMADIQRLLDLADERGAGGFVTTEKDAVKLTSEMLRRLERVGPVSVVRLDAVFVDEAAVMRDLEARIG